jgi:hypothetical protein
MYIVSIFKRHYDKEEYSSLVNIEPCVPVKCETYEEAEKFLERMGFDKHRQSFSKLWTKDDDIAFISAVIDNNNCNAIVSISNIIWNEGHCE